MSDVQTAAQEEPRKVAVIPSVPLHLLTCEWIERALNVGEQYTAWVILSGLPKAKMPYAAAQQVANWLETSGAVRRLGDDVRDLHGLRSLIPEVIRNLKSRPEEEKGGQSRDDETEASDKTPVIVD
ncbi:MAG TPA: hypothetical protein VJJ72_00640 [Candidatus Paceibacterota bacterium]